MRLRTFSTLGVGGVRDAEWSLGDDAGEPAGLVVVQGPPASGKSRLLRAIAGHKEAVAAYGSTGWLSSLVRVDAALCKTIAAWTLTPDEARYGGIRSARAGVGVEVADTPETTSEVTIRLHGAGAVDADPGFVALADRWDPTVSLGRFVSIPAHRLPLPRPSGAGDLELELRMEALSDEPGKLATALGALRRALREGASDPRVDRARALLERFDVGAQLAGMSAAGELEVRVRGGLRVGFSRLAASQQQAVALASWVAVTRLRSSIVLYDTPEAGLPPGLAASWISALREDDPSNQWIVATGDRALAELPHAAVIELGGAR